MKEVVDAVSGAFDAFLETIDALLKENAALKAELAQLSHNKPSMPVCPTCSTPAVTIIRDGRAVCSVCGHSWSGKPAHVG